MRARLGVIVFPLRIDACIAVGASVPRCASWASEEEAGAAFGEFVASAPSFSSIEIGVLKLRESDSEFYDTLLDMGFDVNVLNPTAVQACTQSHGFDEVTAEAIVQLLEYASSA